MSSFAAPPMALESGPDQHAEPQTLIELLQLRARQAPQRRAYSHIVDNQETEESISYAQLDRRARAIAATLQRVAEPGERALLLYPPGLDYVQAFFGCLYAGVIAVPAYPPRPNRHDARLHTLALDSQARLLLTPSATLAQRDRIGAQWQALRDVEWRATDAISDELAELWSPPRLDSGTLAFLQYTSGSTGQPRGVMLSHGNLLHNSRLIEEGFSSTPDDVTVIWLPPYHDMGLIGGILQPIWRGFPSVLIDPLAFLQRPLRWLEIITRARARMSGGPNFAYELCIAKIRSQAHTELDLSSWEVAFNGAEPIRAATLERFTEVFAPYGFRREAFLPCYGLAEATLIVSGCPRTVAPLVFDADPAALEQRRAAPASGKPAQRLVSSGKVLGNQRVVIVRPDTSEPCASDEIGEVWLAGPSVAAGYWNQTEATEASFQARLAGSDAGPFLRTGDLGFLQGDELFIVGRQKDLIIINGRNHYPQDIEQTVEQAHEAVRAGNCAAFSVDVDNAERLVLMIELRRPQQAQEAEQTIRQAVAAQHEIQLHALQWLRPGQLPKTSSGKIRRQACRKIYLEGLSAASKEPAV